MGSIPIPITPDCPEVNAVGVLSPGQSRETANLNTVRTCGSHDYDRPTDAALRGRIIIIRGSGIPDPRSDRLRPVFHQQLNPDTRRHRARPSFPGGPP